MVCIRKFENDLKKFQKVQEKSNERILCAASSIKQKNYESKHRNQCNLEKANNKVYSFK